MKSDSAQDLCFAHSATGLPETAWETMAEHSGAVAELAGKLSAKFGAESLGFLMGQLHDLGKMTPEFQAYIRGERKKGPDHSTAGAREIIALATSATDKAFAQLAAYGIAGHHAGLPDRAGESGLDQRLSREDLPALAANWRDYLAPRMDRLAPQGFKGVADKPGRAFQIAFLGRMLFSALVDADRLSTEAFYALLEGRAVDRAWPALPDVVDSLITRFDAYMAAKAAALSAAARAAPINVMRNDILSHVRSKAGSPKGVFTLDVPTGGGKTLASLAFALDHARAHGIERIVYGIPFTSIIEQSAAIVREALGDATDADGQGRLVLEQHSALDADPLAENDPEAAAFDGKDKLRLAMENWPAPLVITTNVQLFESLFSARPARCRKLHSLCNAVIILDEAQSIPLNLLRPCVAALNELVRNYGCSVVLCTATQPALLAPDFAGGFENVVELAPAPDALHEALRRVTPRLRGEMSDDDLVREMGEVSQGLVIVNGRLHARELYLAAQTAGLEGVIHLTTRQTAADRRKILADIRARLKAGEPCRVIATSLIEAGVDVSFPRVWRAEAGLDSIIQAAGRCARNGEWPAAESFVDVFTAEGRKPPAEIAQFANVFMQNLAGKFCDLFGRSAIERYFQEVYWLKGPALDRVTVPGGRGAQSMADAFQVSNSYPSFDYRSYGEAFRFIEDGMEPVIIAIDDEPQKAVAALRGGAPAGQIARRLQSWIVPVAPKYRKALINNGHVRFVEGFGEQFPILMTDKLYSVDGGLVWEDADNNYLDDFII